MFGAIIVSAAILAVFGWGTVKGINSMRDSSQLKKIKEKLEKNDTGITIISSVSHPNASPAILSKEVSRHSKIGQFFQKYEELVEETSYGFWQRQKKEITECVKEKLDNIESQSVIIKISHQEFEKLVQEFGVNSFVFENSDNEDRLAELHSKMKRMENDYIDYVDSLDSCSEIDEELNTVYKKKRFETKQEINQLEKLALERAFEIAESRKNNDEKNEKLLETFNKIMEY